MSYPSNAVYREQSGKRMVVAYGASFDVQSGGEIDVESGGSLKIAGTAVTASAAELNLIDGSTAGTAVASKAVVLDAGGNHAGIVYLTVGTLDANVLTVNTTVTIPDGSVARAKLSADTNAIYGIPLHAITQHTGVSLAAEETAGTFFANVASDVRFLQGENASNETETSECSFQFVVPPEYVSATNGYVRVKHRLVGTGNSNPSNIDVEVFEQLAGAVGSDLCGTAAQTTLANGDWTTSAFAVDGTNLVAGDVINVVLTSRVTEDVASNNIAAQLEGVALLLSVKG